MTSNILVIGGTGKTGKRVVKNLTDRGHNVRIGGRNNDTAFDWEGPSSNAPALKDMDRAYIVYYPDLAVPGAKEAIKTLTDTALKVGLEKVVLLSGKGEKEAEACEEIVANSGLNYTIIRASWFNQNFSESFLLDPIIAGHVALPMPNAQVPFVDADDIADVVTEVLLNDAYNSQTITTTGPRKMTFKEIIEEIAEGTDREITFQSISQEEYNAAMKAAGLPDDYIWLFDYLFREVLGNPENQNISKDIEKVLGRPASDFREFVKKTAATGIWNQSETQTI